MPLLDVQLNSFKFPNSNLPFFKDIILYLSSGKKYVLLGQSGMGKTTLMKILLDIQIGSIDGNISYFDEDNQLIDLKKIKLKGKIGYLSHEDTLIPWKNVKENLLLPHYLNNNLNIPNNEEIFEVLNKVGLGNNVELLFLKFPYQLSFGMKMRIMLARVFLFKPIYLFLDELFTGLDTINANLVSNLITEYVVEKNIICFSITHDIDKAIEFGDDIIVFNENKELKHFPNTVKKEELISILNY